MKKAQQKAAWHGMQEVLGRLLFRMIKKRLAIRLLPSVETMVTVVIISLSPMPNFVPYL
jgi:hypothetical protein